MKAWQQGWPIEMTYNPAFSDGPLLFVSANKNLPAAAMLRRKTYKFVQEPEIC